MNSHHYQSWVSKNISKVMVNVLYDNLVSISWSVPIKTSPS